MFKRIFSGSLFFSVLGSVCAASNEKLSLSMGVPFSPTGVVYIRISEQNREKLNITPSSNTQEKTFLVFNPILSSSILKTVNGDFHERCLVDFTELTNMSPTRLTTPPNVVVVFLAEEEQPPKERRRSSARSVTPE